MATLKEFRTSFRGYLLAQLARPGAPAIPLAEIDEWLYGTGMPASIHSRPLPDQSVQSSNTEQKPAITAWALASTVSTSRSGNAGTAMRRACSHSCSSVLGSLFQVATSVEAMSSPNRRRISAATWVARWVSRQSSDEAKVAATYRTFLDEKKAEAAPAKAGGK